MRFDATNAADQTIDPAPTATHAGAASGIDKPTLMLLLAGAIVGGGLFLIHNRTKTHDTLVSPTPEETTVKDFAGGGPARLASIDRAIGDAQSLIKRLQSRPAHLAAVRTISGDPFAYTPLEAEPAREPALPPRNHISREEVLRQAVEELRKLRLQSTLAGTARRSCMINDKLYFEGDRIGRFTIEKIELQQVMLRTESLRFTLRLRR